MKRVELLPHIGQVRRPGGDPGIYAKRPWPRCGLPGETQQRRSTMAPRQIGIAFGFHSRNQVTISNRVTKIAEKSDVRTPILSVTANPFTGPEPSQNINAPATRVV